MICGHWSKYLITVEHKAVTTAFFSIKRCLLRHRLLERLRKFRYQHGGTPAGEVRAQVLFGETDKSNEANP